MVEKKVTTKKITTPKKPVTKKPTAQKKAPTTSAVIGIGPESVGFWAGDVYQALAAGAKALSITELIKSAKIGRQEVLLGMGWLFKEGKIKDEGDKVTLA